MLSDARDFNAEHHITGCLLYHDRKFLQLLEGEKPKVISLFNAIESDPRHQSVTVLRTEEREDRIFDRWSMAFYDYGNLRLSAQHKLGQIDSFFEASKAFEKSSKLTTDYFGVVREILLDSAL
jgi:hypothetical protein